MTPRPIDLVVHATSGFGGAARYRGHTLPCGLGRGGLRADKTEGDGATPIGVFSLEEVWLRPDRVRLANPNLSQRAIRPSSGWSDDVRDPDYNCAVRRPRAFRSEAMRRPDPLYDMVGVLSANRDPIQPGAGSAIFLHVWRGTRRPTAGCIAFARADLQWILETWRPEALVIVRSRRQIGV